MAALSRVIRLGYGVLWRVLSVRAAIPLGDGPVLRLAACGKPGSRGLEAAPVGLFAVQVAVGRKRDLIPGRIQRIERKDRIVPCAMKAKGAHETDSQHPTLSVSLAKRAEATYEPTRNTVAKKRAGWEGLDSDYLFDTFLQRPAFR